MKWIVIYAVADSCYVHSFHASTFTDAATVQDAVADRLRQQGTTPELLNVYGPYSRVVTEAHMEPVTIISRAQELDEAIAALDAAKQRLRERHRGEDDTTD